MTNLSEEEKTPAYTGVIIEHKDSLRSALSVVFAALAAGAVLYLLSCRMLSEYDIYFQSRILIPGEILTFLILPVTLGILLVKAGLRAGERGGRGAKALAAIVCTLIAVAAFFYLTAGSLLYALLRAPEIEKDRWLGENWIESVGEESAGLESYRVYHYYVPVAGILKRPYEPLSDIIEWKAQEKYGETFVVTDRDKIRETDETPRVYTLYRESDPELVMHMMAGDSYYGFADDYPQALANRILSQNETFCALAEFAPGVEEGADVRSLMDYFAIGPVIVIDSGEDGRQKAEVIAQAIDGVMEDTFFHMETNCASLTLRICYEEGTSVDVKLPFGNQASHQTNDRTNGMVREDYYTDVTHVREMIQYWYDHCPAESGETSVDGDETAGTDPDGTAEQGDDAASGTELTEDDPETVEGAYSSLYKEVFEPQGDGYECRYNAKGNFYAVLSQGRGTPGEGLPEMDTERTVVYDRISKNGECHLFMYYETYYDENGSEYTTAIRNSYAVNMTTGEVTESGKRSWSQPGSAAYQEAAGEP